MIMRRLGILFALVLSACATGAPAPPTDSVAAASDTSGPYELTFAFPRSFWTEADSITGEATLALVDGPGWRVWGSGSGVLGFAFAQVGGTHTMASSWTLDCATHDLAADRPLTSPITKGVGVADNMVDASFYRAFNSDPLLHLPAGTWDITAIADFYDGIGCAGTHHEMSATVRIDVGR
jgi:hypothetical protein